MREDVKYEVPHAQFSEHDDVAARMRKRHEQLTRRLRNIRIVVRILDFGFGFVPHAVF